MFVISDDGVVCAWRTGFFINYQSDGILRRLRGPGETGYKIPRGEYPFDFWIFQVHMPRISEAMDAAAL